MMTDRSKALFESHSSTEEFLLQRSTTRRKSDKTEAIEPSIQKTLSERFPGVVIGRPFLDHALKLLEDVDNFSTMAIRLENDSAVIEDTDAKSTHPLTGTGILKTIDRLCRNKKGIWGPVDDDLIVLFFPDTGDEACLELAKGLKTRIAGARPNTVTIGIARYPTLGYRKDQIFDNALKAIDHAAFLGPNSRVVFDSVSLNISGDNRYQEGDVNGAIDEYLRALDMDPGNVNVHNSIGVCYGVLGSFDKATASFATAATLDSNEAMAAYNKGLVQMLLHNPAKAIEYFQKAQDIRPDLFEAAYQMGRCHMDLNDGRQARPHLEEAAKLNPESAPAWSCLGECYSLLDMAGEGIRAYEKALKKNPNDAGALSGLGNLYDTRNENTEIATVFCERSVSLSPGNGLFRHRLGKLYLKQDRPEDALKAFVAADEHGYDSAALIEEIRNRESDRKDVPC